jgi:poly-gamma-glutamate synthesis protein (capsule biosynthesis protein)
MLDRSLGQALQRGDLAYPFVGVADQLRAADITVGNLESALGDIGEPAPKRYPFRAPPEAAAALELAGFDIVSLANNHAMDYGPQALHQAIALLQEANVAAVGAGANAQEAHAPLLIEQGGLTLAFLSYVNVPVEASSGFDTAVWTATSESPGLAWADPAQIKADIAGLGEEVDVTIVMLHSGIEYQAAPGEAQQEAARTAIDAGADLVIGHHAHILQGIELYGEGVIIYGTGNFAFEIDGDPATALFHIWLDRQGVREIRLEPVLIQFGGQPQLAEPWIAPGIRRTVYALSNLLNGR